MTYHEPKSEAAKLPEAYQRERYDVPYDEFLEIMAAYLVRLVERPHRSVG